MRLHKSWNLIYEDDTIKNMIEPNQTTSQYIQNGVATLRKSDYFLVRECVARIVALTLSLFAAFDLLLHAIHLPLRLIASILTFDRSHIRKMGGHGLSLLEAIHNLFFSSLLFFINPDRLIEQKISIGTISSNLIAYEEAYKKWGEKYLDHLLPDSSSKTFLQDGLWVWQCKQYPFPEREEKLTCLFRETLQGLLDLWTEDKLTVSEENEYGNQLYPLIQGYLKDKEAMKRLRALFQKYIDPQSKKEQHALQNIYSKNQILKQNRWVNSLVTLTQSEIPKAALLQLLLTDEKSLSLQDKASLDSWIKKLNATPTATATHLLQTLRRLMRENKKDSSEIKNLLCKLYNYPIPCQLLTRPDPLFIKRREKAILRGFVNIREQEKDITKTTFLLGKTTKKLHHTMQIALRDDTKNVVLIDDNPIAAEMFVDDYIQQWQMIRKRYQAPTYPLPLLRPKRGCFGMHIAPASTRMPFDPTTEKMTEIDLRTKMVWKRVLEDFLTYEYTPQCFVPDHLFFIDGQLQILYLPRLDARKDHIHILRMIDTLRSMTEGVDKIYSAVFEELKPKIQDEVNYFLACVEDGLREEPELSKGSTLSSTEFSTLLLRSVHFIHKEGARLREEVKMLRDNILDLCRTSNPPKAASKAAIGAKIKAYYLSQNGFGHAPFAWSQAIFNTL